MKKPPSERLGGVGTEWTEIWMLTGEYAILVIGPPY
jgi:hypothetical protein